MRAHFLMGSIVTAAVAMWSCGGGGGGGSGSSSPSAPSPTPATPAPAAPNSVTISIVGTSGSTAFSPNPVQATTGATLVWKNNTGSVHHLVMDDGSVVGDIAPGASSTPMPLRGGGGNYHCTNHPSMVGSINGASAPPPSDAAPPGDGY